MIPLTLTTIRIRKGRGKIEEVLSTFSVLLFQLVALSVQEQIVALSLHPSLSPIRIHNVGSNRHLTLPCA